jgi:hypothetical protein
MEPVPEQDVYEEFTERVLRPKLLSSLKASNQKIIIKIIKDMPTTGNDIEVSEELIFEDLYPINTIYDLCTRIYIEKEKRDEYHPNNQCLLIPYYDEYLKRTKYIPFQYSFGQFIEGIGLESPFRQMVTNPNKYFVDSEGNATQLQKVSKIDILLEECLYNRGTPEFILHLYIFRDILGYYIGEKSPISRIDWEGKFLVYYPEHKKEHEDGSISEIDTQLANIRAERFSERATVIELLEEMLEGGKPLKRPGETTRGYEVDLSSIRNLRFSWSNRIKGFQLEGLFYDTGVSDIIPYLRFYPRGNTPLTKLYVNDDEQATPMLEDPSVLVGWSEMRSITPDEDLMMAKILLRPGNGSVHPLYATLFVHQDGSSKLVIQPASDEKSLSSQADLLNLSKTLTILSTSMAGMPVLNYTKVGLDDAYIVLSLWLESSDTTRITRKRFDKILPYFKAFFQETTSPIKEQSPILYLRYKCVSNFKTPGREAQFLQRIIDLQKGVGHSSMSFLLKAYKQEFDVDDSTAEQRVAHFLKNMTEYEMTDATTLEFTQKINPGIDIAIFGKFPYYTFHIYRVDSLKTLERIKTLLSLLITVDPVELGSAEDSARVLEKEEDEERASAVAEEARQVERVEEAPLESLKELQASSEGREYKLDELGDLGDFPDEEEDAPIQTIDSLVRADAEPNTAGAPAAIPLPQQQPPPPVKEAQEDVEEEDYGSEEEAPVKGKGKRKAVPSPKSYFWMRLKSIDKKLFVYSKKGEGSSKGEITQYPSACAANALKQPAVMTEIQYKIMRDIYEADTRMGRVQWIEYPLEEDETIPVVKKESPDIVTEKITVLRYGSNLAEGQTNVYTCSEFWCMKEGMVILKEDFMGRIGRDGKAKEPQTCPFCRNGLVKKEHRGKMTPGEKVIRRTTKDKSVEGKAHLYVQFLKSSIHPEGLYLPCCFLTDKIIQDKHPAFASRKAESLRLVAGIPEEVKASLVEHVPMTASYSERLKKVASSYISGAEKLPLDFIDGVPKIGILPPSADAYFAQKSIPDLVKQDHTVWKLMTDNLTGLPNASGFFRIAVENRKLFEADSFFAAIAPYFECSGANELRTLISTLVTPTLTASLNYGNFMFEFYNPQYRDPTQTELVQFTTAMGMQTSIGVRKEYIKRLWKSHMNFNDSLKSTDITKECRQFYNLFTIPNLFKWTSSTGKTYANGILFIILEINKEGAVEVKHPPYGVTPSMAETCDIAFLLHYKAQRIWEPIFYTRNIPKKSISTTTMVFAKDVSGSWPDIVLDRYNEFIEKCKSNGLGLYTESAEVAPSSLIPLSNAMKITDSDVQIYAILRDVYNHVYSVLYRVGGEIIFLPVIDDGTIYKDQRVEFDWKNFLRDVAPIEKVRTFYENLDSKYRVFDDLVPAIKNSYVLKTMFRLNKSAKDYPEIYGLKLQGGLFIPIKKGSVSEEDMGTEEGTQLTWAIDNEIVFGKKQTVVAEFDEKEFEEVYQHLRFTFANWLSQMREKDALVQSIRSILFDVKGNINLLDTLEEKRQRLFILFGHIILSWLDSSLEVVYRKPSLKRVDCRVITDKSMCSNRCVWKEDSSTCLLHVNEQTLVGRKMQNGKYVLVKRLLEELLRFPRKREELLTKGVRQYIKLTSPFRSGNEYIIPENLPEWKELLRMEWRHSKDEKPRFAEEFTSHGEFIETSVSTMPALVQQYFGKQASKLSFLIQESESIFPALEQFGLMGDALEKIGQKGKLFDSVKMAQACAKVMKLSIYQVSYDESGVPSDPIVVKGRLTIKGFQPFLVIIRLPEGIVGIVSADKSQIHPIELDDLPKGMKDRIKGISPTGMAV